MEKGSDFTRGKRDSAAELNQACCLQSITSLRAKATRPFAEPFLPMAMITWADVCHVLEATVPLYAAMIFAYASVRWWKLFTPEECSVINKFVSKIFIPLLSYQVISANNPYKMNLELLLADVVQKLLALLMLAAMSRFCIERSLDLLITGFSVSTMPNTLIVGILEGMYGEEAARLLGQIVALQCLVRYTVLLFLFELRAARVNAETGDDYTEEAEHDGEDAQVQKTSKSYLVLLMLGRKLMTNPNTYSCIAGLVWSLISFRWDVALPLMVENSINILANGGLGMAMFSIGLVMASQSTVIACSARTMVLSMALRFVAGPALMAIPCYAEKTRVRLLSMAIIQAALPQGIVPFVFAKDYGVYPEVLSTGVIVGMFVAIPVPLVYSIIVDHE